MADIQQVRKGSTSLLILHILEEGPRHGYAIMRELEQNSDGYFSMTAALLYPALHEMEQEKLVEAVWEEIPGKKRRKIYSITQLGREHLTQGQSEWRRFVDQLRPFLYATDRKRGQYEAG
jgi:PadR family transcriptional regulator, regulatory protein PadR